MPRSKPSSPQSTKEHSDTPSQTTDASDEKPFDPTRSRDEAKIYDDAAEDNRQRDFVHAITEARKPVEQVAHAPPVIPAAIAEQTRLEMEAGAKRVMEFAAQEIERQEAHERHKNDKWADKGSVEVFRPHDYVPDQKKGEGHVKATSAPLE